MFATTRIKMRPLSEFCNRISTALEAGLDLRKILDREAQRGTVKYRESAANLSNSISRGASFTDALNAQGGYFPDEFISMVDVGERTGRLEHILKKMAVHYEDLLRTRNYFFMGIIWPGLQFVLATLVIALLIMITGWIGDQDIVGFGLMGVSGAIKFLCILYGTVAVLFLVIKSCINGALAKPIMNTVMRIPKLGPSLRTLMLARFASSLSLAVEAGLDAKSTVELALNSTNNEFFKQHIPQVQAAVGRGDEIHSALAATGAFPQSVLDAVEMGEQTGRFAESMDRLTDHLHSASRVAVGTLVFLAGLGIWLFVGGLIIYMIFRLANIYFGAIYDALEGI